MNVKLRGKDNTPRVRRALLVVVACAWGLSGEAGFAQPRVVKDVYGVGVLGNCCTHGVMSCRQFNHRKDTRVVAAFEQNARRAKELADAVGKPLAESYDAVIRHPDVDIVAITCDPADKPAMVERAAAAGKAIFLNKPPCASLDGARRITQAVRDHNAWLVHDIPMVRLIPVYARLLEEVLAKKHGTVMGYHHLFGMNFDPAFDLKRAWPERLDPPEKSGGGEMTNMGVYAIDFAVNLFGRPRAVTAKWRKQWDVYREADVENFGQIVLDYGDFFAFLEVGKQQLVGKSRHSNSITINFEHRTMMIDASAQLATINHVPVDWNEFGKDARAVGSIDQLLAAMREGTPPTSSVDNIAPAMEVLMAAYQSIVEGRTVKLPVACGANPLVESR